MTNFIDGLIACVEFGLGIGVFVLTALATIAVLLIAKQVKLI